MMLKILVPANFPPIPPYEPHLKLVEYLRHSGEESHNVLRYISSKNISESREESDFYV